MVYLQAEIFNFVNIHSDVRYTVLVSVFSGRNGAPAQRTSFQDSYLKDFLIVYKFLFSIINVKDPLNFH